MKQRTKNKYKLYEELKKHYAQAINLQLPHVFSKIIYNFFYIVVEVVRERERGRTYCINTQTTPFIKQRVYKNERKICTVK